MLVTTFIWDDVFVTGFEAVDEQHHRLVDMINKLAESLINSHGTDEIETIFGELAKYVIYHFGEEERLMLSAGLDERHAGHHRNAHRQFAEQVTTMWQTRHLMDSFVHTLLEFLTSWLSFHILGEDQAMARQIARIQAGSTPAQAFEAESGPQDRATVALLGALRNLVHVLSKQNEDLANTNQTLEARVTERTHALKKANQRLELLSRTDGLLEIANRMYFDDRIKHEWKIARRSQHPISLLMLDVDFFKYYNDTYGHLQGDACLREVAKAAVKGTLRETDLVARYGGEEMVVLLPNTELEGACRVAKRIQSYLQERAIPHAASKASDCVTISVGVACMEPAKDEKLEDLILAADVALYQAKRRGRNQIFVKTDDTPLDTEEPFDEK